MRLNLKVLSSISLLFWACSLCATHNRSGEITYTQIGPLTIEATITTYTKASSTGADRDTLRLQWGDGTSTLVGRSNGDGDIIPGEDIKINYYIAQHTYPGRATYTLAFMDRNRVNNIQNVNFPNSVDVPFYVQTTFTFLNTQFQGFNNSVVLLQPPIDYACVGQVFIHNPNAYDPDGDSLSYALVVPLQTEDTEVPRYEDPNEILPGPDNNISLDPETGDFVWDSPRSAGEYNIAIRINEYRDGVLLNSVIRDMQIFVDMCMNNPPVIESIDEICVIAGTRIEIPIGISDPDQDQQVRLSATGGPFLVPFSRAVLTGNNRYGDVPRTELLIWETKCEHISDSYYQVVLRAQDNFDEGTSGLAVLKTIRIKVLGPPPEDVQSEVLSDTEVKISWANPYACETTIDDYFIGFSVWRKEGSQPITIDSCQGGLEGYGYTPVNFLTQEKEGDRYVYTDKDLERSKIYCYRVLANFAARTQSGNPFNIVESLPSEEVCVQTKQDLPLITKVSVDITDTNNGTVNVDWIKPYTEDLDTMINTGPYRYEVRRSTDGVNFNQITNGEYSTPNFSDPISLEFLDTGLNTFSNTYYYVVDFYSNDNLYISSPIAGSVFLSISSSDQVNSLSWDEDVSWVNYDYKVFKADNASGPYVEIATTPNQQYEDMDVINNVDYCYKIESEGTYGLSTTPSPLFNFSQSTCGTPIDSVGPCAPELTVESPCDLLEAGIELQEIFNTLNWNMPNLICENSGDIDFYRLYFTPNLNDELTVLAELDALENTFEHAPEMDVTGCYAISALDTLGNEGPLSPLLCLDSCPIYKLPNTFTPNGDGSNDLFIPLENRFVTSVDFKVFNRWGNLIFETSNPDILWSGVSTDGTEVTPGTYYYTCKIFENSFESEPVELDFLSGNLQLFR